MLQSDGIYFMLLNRIFCRISSGFHHISSAFHMTEMGVANWVESQFQRRHWLLLAVLFLLKPIGKTEGEEQEKFIIEQNCSLPPWNGLT